MILYTLRCSHDQAGTGLSAWRRRLAALADDAVDS